MKLFAYYTKVKIVFCGWGDSKRFKIFDQSFVDRRIIENYFLHPHGGFRDMDCGRPFHAYTMPSSPIKEGKLRSGAGNHPIVKNYKQAVAIGLSMKRKANTGGGGYSHTKKK